LRVKTRTRPARRMTIPGSRTQVLPRRRPSRSSELGHRLRGRIGRGAVRARSLDLRSSSPASLATLVTPRRATGTAHDVRTPGGAVRLLRGRFEARFEDADAARAAARDGRAVGFIVDVRRDTTGWVAVGRRGLPFPSDERDRYASRFSLIATEHGGAFGQFVEEPEDTSAANAVDPSARGQA
jgi:hypothetical protein